MIALVRFKLLSFASILKAEWKSFYLIMYREMSATAEYKAFKIAQASNLDWLTKESPSKDSYQ